jgi:hypothetical protein
MDPDARAEALGVLARVWDVVPVREEDVVDAAGAFEPLRELGRKARRIDEQVTARTRDEVGLRAEGRARVERSRIAAKATDECVKLPCSRRTTGRPRVQNAKVAVLDFGAGLDGPLVAYRWNGESELTDEAFVTTG